MALTTPFQDGKIVGKSGGGSAGGKSPKKGSMKKMGGKMKSGKC